MKTAEPRKTVFLAVAAVGACGYLGYSLLGLGNGFAARSSPSSGPPAAEDKPDAAVLGLRGDPYSHSELLNKKRSAASLAQMQNPASSTPIPPAATPDFAGPWRVPSSLPGTLNINPTSPAAPPTPAETTGGNRTKEEESRTIVRLTAVVSVNQSVAFVSVSGSESRSYRVGEAIAGGWRLVAIEDGAIWLARKRTVRKLEVGSEVSL